ncbi:MAG TPA: DNA gyrase inhibitor YacG [Steroidobacteraceae bacterium]|nr:DNA gyrase inhibitor YacG [Steroidobacteraceae bacterium]
MATTVKCPTCRRAVEWSPESLYRPFCSERCRLIDLGAWLSEERKIPDEAGAERDSASEYESGADLDSRSGES